MEHGAWSVEKGERNVILNFLPDGKIVSRTLNLKPET